ncbi:MAG: hemolysin family protein [Candidatus Eremiobacteraeota bacterium]|nr:hemolysin family protein [Candidatus Eremiobacteraeota bacterium]
MEPHIAIPFENNYLILLILLFCIGCVAFFSSSEAALISVNRIRIKNLVEKGNKQAKAVERVISKHDKLFATILTTENMFIILASSLAGVLAVSLLGKNGIAISTLFMTIFIVIFGEITPKTFAAQNAVKVSLLVGQVMEKIIYVLSPVISLFAFISRSIIKALGVNPASNPYLLTEDEIKMVISDGAKEGVLAKAEKKMIEGIFEFSDTLAGQIMVPRVDMVAVSDEEPLAKAIELINKTGHSRIPVREGTNVDHIVGVVYAKDILKHMERDIAAMPVKEIMRSPHFAPESQNVMALLSDLREKKASITFIIDEFGGTAGMITIEMLLEEIVGDIEDEFDISLPKYEKISDDEYIVDAKMTIYELKEKLDIELPEGDYQTVGGFVINLVENIPSLGDTVEYGAYEFIIEKTESYRLSRIRVRRKKSRKKANHG